MGCDTIKDFTLEDFDTGKVFEYLTSIKDPYEQGMEERRTAALAKELGFRDFKKLFGLYKKKLKELTLPVITDDGVSEFGDQPFELNTGEWTADEGGIWKHGNNGTVWACSHPYHACTAPEGSGYGAHQSQTAVLAGPPQKRSGGGRQRHLVG